MPLATKNWSRFEALLDNNLTIHQIEQEGAPALWRKGVVCPNRIVGKNNHDLNCALCDGTGFLYDAGTEIKALTTSIGVKQMWEAFGRYDVGTSIISVNPANQISWWDMVEFPEATIRYSEVIKRDLVTGIDKLKYTPVAPVRFVDSLGTDYVIDTDFTFVNNTVQWITDPSPYVSASYTCHPRYILLELVHHYRRSTVNHAGLKFQADFPLQAVAKLDFLIGDESKTA